MNIAGSPTNAVFASAGAVQGGIRLRLVCGCLLLLCFTQVGAKAAPAGDPVRGLQAQSGSQTKPGPAAGANGTSPAPQTTPRPWTRYCLKTASFCFDYPSSWSNLGPVFDGAGVVVAEPQQRRPREEWNQITAAAVELPEPAAGSELPGLDELITLVLAPTPGTAIRTMQRRNTVIGGYPAQVVTAEVQEPEKPPGTELIAFIDADGIIYSVALRCAPAELKRLQPLFEHALRSWREMPATPGSEPHE